MVLFGGRGWFRRGLTLVDVRTGVGACTSVSVRTGVTVCTGMSMSAGVSVGAGVGMSMASGWCDILLCDTGVGTRGVVRWFLVMVVMVFLFVVLCVGLVCGTALS